MKFVVWSPFWDEATKADGRTITVRPDDTRDLEAILESWVEEYDNQSAGELTVGLLDGVVVHVCEEGSEEVRSFTLRAEASLNYYAAELLV